MTWMRVAEFAKAAFGRDDKAAKARVRRLTDAGTLRCITTGRRGDRLIPSSELERWQELASAGDDGRTGGDDAPAA